MRFAFVVSAGLGYHIPNLFKSRASYREFDRALEIIKNNGFEGVELNLHLADSQTLSRIKDSIDRSGLELAAVGTGLVYLLGKMSFTDPNRTRRIRALSIVKRLIAFAGSNHAPVVIGSIRGQSQRNLDAARVHLRDCLVECDYAARRLRTRIAIEAINRYETAFLNTASEVATSIESAKLESTGILLDAFHMNIEERSLEEVAKQYSSRLLHFHMSDSNRWPPGYGHLEIGGLLNLLRDLNYGGWVSAEPLPKPGNVEAVEATAKFLRTSGFMRS